MDSNAKAGRMRVRPALACPKSYKASSMPRPPQGPPPSRPDHGRRRLEADSGSDCDAPNKRTRTIIMPTKNTVQGVPPPGSESEQTESDSDTLVLGGPYGKEEAPPTDKNEPQHGAGSDAASSAHSKPPWRNQAQSEHTVGVGIDAMVHEVLRAHRADDPWKALLSVDAIPLKFWERCKQHRDALCDALWEHCNSSDVNNNEPWKLLESDRPRTGNKNNPRSQVALLKSARAEIEGMLKLHSGEFRSWAGSHGTDLWIACDNVTQTALFRCYSHPQLAVWKSIWLREKEWRDSGNPPPFKDCFNSEFKVLHSVDEGSVLSDKEKQRRGFHNVQGLVYRATKECRPNINVALSRISVMDENGQDVCLRANHVASLAEVFLRLGHESGYKELYARWMTGNVAIARRIDTLAGDRELIG